MLYIIITIIIRFMQCQGNYRSSVAYRGNSPYTLFHGNYDVWVNKNIRKLMLFVKYSLILLYIVINAATVLPSILNAQIQR